ncbi:hypothetical protein ACFVWG_03250 [Kribbella sp. NPDC058245]|uniref:hypothetical protein n=1 Tax=Kribbella sp. NPDC058245 TaxID=3346399 RepID=UPI0036E1ED56
MPADGVSGHTALAGPSLRDSAASGGRLKPSGDCRRWLGWMVRLAIACTPPGSDGLWLGR